MALLTHACGWLALSALVAAAQPVATTTQTYAASANFAYVSDDGCILNEVTVLANRTTVVSAAAPKTTSEVTYTRYRYDYCENADLGTDLGTSSQPVFSADLSRASLNARINGHSETGSPVMVSFALVWEGKGSIARPPSRPRDTPGSKAKSIRTVNQSRNAVVRGSIEEQDVSGAAVDAGLHTTRRTISR